MTKLNDLLSLVIDLKEEVEDCREQTEDLCMHERKADGKICVATQTEVPS